MLYSSKRSRAKIEQWGLVMIRVLTIGVLVLGLFSLLLFPHDHNPVRAATSGTEMQHSDTETIIQMEKDLLKVRLTRDPEAVEAVGKVLADDWVNLEPDRRGPGKAGMMEFLHQRSGPLSPSSMRQQDLQVFLFGNTAVATYFFGDTAKPDEHFMDVTDVFMKDGGTWKLRLSRSSHHFQQ